jgi:LDH2 family malate/lactate/ureidoglycolate dehydrogenase
MAAYLRTSPPLDTARPVLMPGEREQAAAEALGDGPISVDGPTWTALTALAARHDIALPNYGKA